MRSFRYDRWRGGGNRKFLSPPVSGGFQRSKISTVLQASPPFLCCIGVGASNFLGIQKFISQNFIQLAQKVVVQLLPTVFGVTSKNGLNLFFCKRWAPFFEVKQRWAPFCPDFQGFCLDIWGFYVDFQGFYPNFPRMLPRFSTNQNFWECAWAPCLLHHCSVVCAC